MQLHESGISEDQRQRTDQPYGSSQFDDIRYGMKVQPSDDGDKDCTGQKRKRTGQSNRSPTSLRMLKSADVQIQQEEAAMPLWIRQRHPSRKAHQRKEV
jgi:hypothetical protein